jgi:predicted O-methyltransferase YrrM
MSQEQWSAIDRYISEHFVPVDRALEAALQASDAAGMPQINVAPNQGKLLQLLARSIGARKILEIGTLGGYSTIWLARALPPGGRLITLEFNPAFAEVARANIVRAGVADRVEIKVGTALDSLPKIEGLAPFDLIFIDADKENNSAYFHWALKLAQVGSLIIVDNVVREGGVIDQSRHDAHIEGVREFYATAAAETRVSMTAIQTVGSKGHDGFAIGLVTAAP